MFHTPTNAAFTILFANFETTFTLLVSCIFKSAIYRPYGGGCRGTMYILEQLEKCYVGPFRGPPIAPSPTLYSVHYLHTTIPACHTTSVCTRLGRWWYAGPFRGPIPPATSASSVHCSALPTCTSAIPVHICWKTQEDSFLGTPCTCTI